MTHRFLAALSFMLACALAPLPAAAQAKTLRFASAFDPQSMDPHALALLYQTRVVTQVYEGLVNRGKDFKLELVLIDESTSVRQLKKELRWNEAYYHLANGL